jgi:hypothetical protein
MLVVQSVQILWTKATRGAPRSNERVALPRAFPVNASSGEYVIQRYRIAEWEGFVPKLVATEIKESVAGSEDVLRISREPEGSFRLGLAGSPNAGQPKRHPRLNAIHLLPGEYARLVVNARHTTYSGQYYSETVFNVACGEHVPPNRFLLGSPEHELDLKANLF